MRLLYRVPAARPAGLLLYLFVQSLLNQSVASGTISRVGDAGGLDSGTPQKPSLQDGVSGHEVGVEANTEYQNPYAMVDPLHDSATEKGLRDFLAAERAPLRGMKRMVAALIMIGLLYLFFHVQPKYKLGYLDERSDEREILVNRAYKAAEEVFLGIYSVARGLNLFLPKEKSINPDTFIQTISITLFFSGVFEFILSILQRRGWARRRPYPLRGIVPLISAAVCFAFLLAHSMRRGEDFSPVDRQLTEVGTSLMFIGSLLLHHSLRKRSEERRKAQEKRASGKLQEELAKAMEGTVSDNVPEDRVKEKPSSEPSPAAVVQP